MSNPDKYNTHVIPGIYGPPYNGTDFPIQQAKASPIVANTIDDTERAIESFCRELANLLIKKRRDYGSGNIKEFGQLGVIVRASDKLHRLKNLETNVQMPSYETVQDTWKDLAGYAVIGALDAEGKW